MKDDDTFVVDFVDNTLFDQYATSMLLMYRHGTRRKTVQH